MEFNQTDRELIGEVRAEVKGIADSVMEMKTAIDHPKLGLISKVEEMHKSSVNMQTEIRDLDAKIDARIKPIEEWIMKDKLIKAAISAAFGAIGAIGAMLGKVFIAIWRHS